MTGLREHFAETADRAKHYDVTGAAMRRARRHNLITRGVAAAAALLAAGTAAVAVTSDRGTPAPDYETVDATRPATTGRLDWLPPTLIPSEPAQQPVLPTDRGVGPGALVYRTATPGAAQSLLTSDGKSYQVPGDARGMSPDGRWLAYEAGGDLVFHSLVDGRTRRVVDSDVAGWSVDGTLAVLARRRPDVRPPEVATVYRPEDGRNQTVPVPDPAWWSPRGMSADGELLLMPRRLDTVRQDVPLSAIPGLSLDASATPQPDLPVTTESPAPPPGTLSLPPSDLGFGVGFVDPVDQTSRSVSVLANTLGLTDPFGWHGGVDEAIRVRPDTGGLVFQPQVRVPASESRTYSPADVYEVDPGTGLPLRRFRLPAPGSEKYVLRLIAVGADGFLLSANDDRSPWMTTRLETLDPVTGDRRTVLRATGEVQVVFTRGGAFLI
ncbi:hypothetical protein Ais01nite_21710 [Asanoa ishikariensis]|uniref:WD40-like Beta Propeller Repeat n=1 Tax=Asanoa ishikariensis TaxID=137265 RepID=A0A1H3U7C4_9ACTN|nr:hypothetical protein [Asanoa ishikariensis]GIF64136.1 hypothetical protein Ais01nite_21710 [Asanoa ishikariensis]SDZ58384.1 hypothetical protein SAMN05421684_6703 [Asanoa ishikariensis]